MRTNIVLDDDLINVAIKLSGVKTKKDVISFALQEFVAMGLKYMNKSA